MYRAIDGKIKPMQIKQWTGDLVDQVDELGFAAFNMDELSILHYQLIYGKQFKAEAECHCGHELTDGEVALLAEWVDCVWHTNEDVLGSRDWYTA